MLKFKLSNVVRHVDRVESGKPNKKRLYRQNAKNLSI